MFRELLCVPSKWNPMLSQIKKYHTKKLQLHKARDNKKYISALDPLPFPLQHSRSANHPLNHLYFFQAMEQYKRYEGLSSQCKAVSGTTDLAHFVRSLPAPPHNRTVVKRLFCPPQPPIPDQNEDGEKITDIQNVSVRHQW